MSAIAVYPPDASDPEIVYLQRDPQSRATPLDLSSISSLTTTLPSRPPPPIPRKSSRRGLRLSVVPEIEPVFPDSPVESSAASSSSPAELSSGSPATSISNDDALDSAIKQLEICQGGGARPPSYASADHAPPVPKRSSSRKSSVSSARYSDVPPEYQIEPPPNHPLESENALTLTAAEKEALKSALEDADADAELAREESVYSLHIDDNVVEQISPSSIESKTLRIQAKGMHPIGLPLPSKELTILITNSDQSLAYTSTRLKRTSPHFTLSTPGVGDVLKTSYEKQPIITPIGNDGVAKDPFTMKGKGLRRLQTFRFPDNEGQEFEWRYGNVKKARGRREERLVLIQKPNNLERRALKKVASATRLEKPKRFSIRRSPSSSSGILGAARATTKPAESSTSAPRILAQLLRVNQSQEGGQKGAPGYARAGHGGDLVLEPGCTDLVPEEVVIATALVMMKREQDRLRAVQAAVIVAAIL